MRAIDDLVRQEVIHNANQFMWMVQEDVDSEWFESFDNVYDDTIETIEEWFMYECEDELIEDHIYNFISKKIDDNYTIGMALDDLSSIDKESLAELCGFEPKLHEILEWWIVSEWLANKLIDHGEPVAKDYYGFHIWGRTCSGQSITIDSVILNIHQSVK